MRLFAAFRAFFAVLFGRRLEDVQPALESAPLTSQLAVVADTTALERRAEQRGAVQLLALLQREGRLCDFLAESIDDYKDAQIGAAVRDVHRGLRRVLADHLPTEPIFAEAEESKVRVDPGFDPYRIRLTGRVVGEAPYSGTLRHRGWRVREVKLPERTGGGDELTVVAPAEVEL